MTSEAEHVIQVENLTKRYGSLQAVNDISFTVRKGEVFAFLGANGAGKSTTVEIIETIRTPTSGKVRLFGMDVTKKKRELVQRIGVLPQGFSSFDRITVRETIQYYARLFGCGNIKVRLEHTDDVQKILNAVQQGGASFGGLDVRKPNLEEVFLKLTGETLHKDSAGERGAA